MWRILMKSQPLLHFGNGVAKYSNAGGALGGVWSEVQGPHICVSPALALKGDVYTASIPAFVDPMIPKVEQKVLQEPDR